MRPGGSRAKGYAFERKIAKLLSEATGNNYKRTPESGAIGTKSNIQTLRGDIFNADHMDKYPYFWELKKYKEVKLLHFIQGLKSCKISEWLTKIQDQQADYQIGFLVFEEDRGKPIIIHEISEVPKSTEFVVFSHNGFLYQVEPFLSFLAKNKDKL